MKILEVELLSDDINRTEQFYNEVLGLPTIYKDKSCVSFETVSTKLTFRASVRQFPVYHFAFDIPNNKLIEAFIWIRKKTPIMEVIPPDKIADFYRWNAKSFYFYDNNGNIVEFIARFDLDNASPNRFSGSSILSISEIGFVSKNVEQQCREMYRKYGLTVFPRQPKLNKFIVLGTQTGLFILVEENRYWFPTDKKSKSFWTQVIFESKGQVMKIEVI